MINYVVHHTHMEYSIAIELQSKLVNYPLISKYLGQSLIERSKANDWFENRLLRAILLDKQWIKDKEELLKKSQIDQVANAQEIFKNIRGYGDYDMQLFDTLTEIEVISWARSNGYTHIDKITSEREKVPDFIMSKGQEMHISEAKDFRERDYLLDFIYDRLAGLMLVTKAYRKIGLKIETTLKYEQIRDCLAGEKTSQKQARIVAARDSLPSDILIPLLNGETNGLQVINGLFNIETMTKTGAIEVSSIHSSDPRTTCLLMLEKIQGKLQDSLKQIATFCNKHGDENISKAIVFLSGTDQSADEWDTMWDVLIGFNDREAWMKVEQLYLDAQKLIGIPFELMTVYDAGDYVTFPRSYEQGKHLYKGSIRAHSDE